MIAPEFPPTCGGVGDYTALVAAGLTEAGDRVQVWHPGVLPDRFGTRSRRIIARAAAGEPGPILVQYVPAAFGCRGLNVPFCLWLARQGRRGADVRVMFHEPFFYFGLERPWRNVLAVGQRVMASILLRAATRVYYSTETWRRLLAPYGPQSRVEVLPIPSTIPVDVPREAVAAARRGTAASIVVGHFGTYGEHVSGVLRPVVGEICNRLPHARVLLAGRDAEAFVATLDSRIRPQVDVLAAAEGDAIAAALRACDVLVQPYPDGVTTRRTSMMGALTTGIAVVTTAGPLTEPVWSDSGAVALETAGDAAALAARVAQLAGDSTARRELGARGRRLYDERFALPVTIARLRLA